MSHAKVSPTIRSDPEISLFSSLDDPYGLVMVNKQHFLLQLKRHGVPPFHNLNEMEALCGLWFKLCVVLHYTASHHHSHPADIIVNNMSRALFCPSNRRL